MIRPQDSLRDCVTTTNKLAQTTQLLPLSSCEVWLSRAMCAWHVELQMTSSVCHFDGNALTTDYLLTTDMIDDLLQAFHQGFYSSLIGCGQSTSLENVFCTMKWITVISFCSGVKYFWKKVWVVKTGLVGGVLHIRVFSFFSSLAVCFWLQPWLLCPTFMWERFGRQ